MTKLTDIPEVMRLVKTYRRVAEAIEIGEDYSITVKGNEVIVIAPSVALPILNNRLNAISTNLNILGVDTSV